jgi:hypothetical protein
VDGGARQAALQVLAGHAAVQRLGVALVNLARVVHRHARMQVAHARILLLHARGKRATNTRGLLGTSLKAAVI